MWLLTNNDFTHIMVEYRIYWNSRLFLFLFSVKIDISMALCKTTVTPLLTHWSYCSLAPSIDRSSTISLGLAHGSLDGRYGTGVKLAPDSPASYSRIWGWRIWCQLHAGTRPYCIPCIPDEREQHKLPLLLHINLPLWLLVLIAAEQHSSPQVEYD